VFNRGGFTAGYAGGARDASIYFAERPNHLGLPVGTVLHAQGGRALIEESAELHPGDGLEARGGGEAIGLTVEGAERGPAGTWIRAPKGLRARMSLHRTSDALQLEAARQSYAAERKRRKIKIWFRCVAGEKAALRLGEAEVAGEVPLKAVQRGLREDQVRQQLEKLGESIFEAEEIQIELGEGLFLPLSAINALRREAVAQLTAKMLAEALPNREILPDSPPRARALEPGAPLRVQRSGSVRELLDSKADELEYAPADYTLPSLRAAILSLQEAKQKVRLCLPPFLEEEELRGIVSLLSETGTAAVANNLSQLYALGGMDYISGEGLNAFNTRAALALQGLGAKRVRLSPECTLEMAADIAKAAPAELLAQGWLPAMILRSCPLRANEGLHGDQRERCNLCKREGYFLRDRKDAQLPLRPYYTENGCTVVAYNPFPLDIGENGRERLKNAPFAAITEERLPEGGQRTRGHFFRGVE
jgi:putative protease